MAFFFHVDVVVVVVVVVFWLDGCHFAISVRVLRASRRQEWRLSIVMDFLIEFYSVCVCVCVCGETRRGPFIFCLVFFCFTGVEKIGTGRGMCRPHQTLENVLTMTAITIFFNDDRRRECLALRPRTISCCEGGGVFFFWNFAFFAPRSCYSKVSNRSNSSMKVNEQQKNQTKGVQ